MTLLGRERCFEMIKGEAAGGGLTFAVSFVGAEKIDRIGLSLAIREAIKNSMKKLGIAPTECLVLLDGALRAPSIYINQRTIIKGDEKEKIISLASIVAKVTRD